MRNPYSNAPHADLSGHQSGEAPNAALLIDFDNVTMGMRSDLAKELRHLLDADVIKGKVTVQRAYADWRRYPQYIVPLSEASIDLIFAPAYGSSKKNATDIRMAIDGIELVFIRPEIGTYILLTGDSDFSSLVLKLKEYGKYVIGIGIQESSSDILVQNCDEYYSYSSIAGLSRESEGGGGPPDAWQLVGDAVKKMVSRGDVMRSDRLKQVIMELSPDFSERNLGFKKFSKFLVEAANKGLLEIERADNGQHTISPPAARRGGQKSSGREERAAANGRSRRSRGRRARTKQPPRAETRQPPKAETKQPPKVESPPARGRGELDPKALGLPTSESSIKSYLANRYKGVGDKTAERIVSHFGKDTFRVVHQESERVRSILPRSRADAVLAAWAGDYERRARELAPTNPRPSRSRGRGGSGSAGGGGRAKKAEKAPARAKASGHAGAGANSRRAPKAAVEAPAPDRLADASEDGGGEDGATVPRKRRSGLMGYIRQGLRSRSE